MRKNFRTLAQLRTDQIDIARISNPTLRTIVQEVVEQERRFVFFGKGKGHTDHKESRGGHTDTSQGPCGQYDTGEHNDHSEPSYREHHDHNDHTDHSESKHCDKSYSESAHHTDSDGGHIDTTKSYHTDQA